MVATVWLLTCMLLVTRLQYAQGQIIESLRLVDNVGQMGGSSGRLEIYINGEWGTVCANGFSTADAEVACRFLTFNTYTTFGRVEELGFSPGTTFQKIWLDNLRCQGTEESLNSCSHSGLGNHDCTHSQDIGLTCGGEGSLRLQDGSRTYGRLEVYYSGQWGTVCDDDFDGPDADVVCRELGFTVGGYCWGKVEQFSISQVSETVPIWLDDLRCGRNNTALLNCPHSGLGVEDCTHSEDVGVACAPRSDCDGNIFSNNDDTTYIYYYTFGGTVVGILIGICIFYLICRACPYSNNHPPRPHPLPPRPHPLPRTHTHSQTHPPPSRTSGNVISQHRASKHVPTKTTWITQAPPGYLTVVGSPAYKLEKSLRPSITLPPFREREEQDYEPPGYPADIDELDTFPLL